MNHQTLWTVEKITQRLRLLDPLVYRRSQPLSPFRFKPLPNPATPPPLGPEAESEKSDWTEIPPHTYWAGWRTDFCLRGHFQFPKGWSKAEPTVLAFSLGRAGDFEHPEALLYVDGQAFATVDRHHAEILLPESWLDGQPHELALHGWTGNGGGLSGQPDMKLLMGQNALVQLDQSTRDFIATARTTLGIARALPPESPARGLLLTALNEAFRLLDLREPHGAAFYPRLPAAQARLKAAIAGHGPVLPAEVYPTGHDHLDTAWLWNVGQTRRKAGRTFHNVLRLMEQFPTYHFSQSQPQLYDYVRQDYPALFEGIQRRVAEERWEPIGGMWVEADCNLTGPESLARQFLLGRTFFRQYFGPEAETRVLWLPDVFGYAWNLPQLIKQAGLDYFFTIKIGWSQYNRLPFDSFWWQGLDGTRVLTHFSPTPEIGSVHASTYNAEVTPQQVLGTWTNFRQKDLSGVAAQPPLLMAFGYGDGGGGPTREMLENVRELANFPATPHMRFGSVKHFFEALEQSAGPALPVWNGELYLELHRGTYTTQSRNKRANRKSEFLLHDAEFLAAYANLLDPAYTYPAADLRHAWELVCLNQFHDIIPGSSIGPVYVESQQHYAEIKALAEKAQADALAVIGERISGNILVIEPTSFARRGVAFWPHPLPNDQGLQDSQGHTLATQAIEGGTLIQIESQPYSVSPLRLTAGAAIPASSPNDLTVSPTLLENELLRVEFNSAGDITRIYHKPSQRAVLPTGALANQFQAFEDRPMYWDAWDVDIFYSDKQWLAEPAESVRVAEAGPLRATLEIKRRILNSPYTQRISLESGSDRLDVVTEIDWREKHILLKVAFPVDVLSPVATYEIQWGHVQRSTHWNTSWDWARFETCAQKWVDLSEGGFGVSLLNDCKYGHDIHDNVIRLSLLRSPTEPDPHADEGEHRFAYSLLPHAGNELRTTMAQAYSLNDPVLVWDKAAGSWNLFAPDSLVKIEPSDGPQPIIETIKRAEDGQGLIVRLYECQRRRGPVTLHTAFPFSAAWQTNLLEENQTPLPIDGHTIHLDLKPFQIMTMRLVPK